MWDQYDGVARNNELQHVGRARPRAARKPGVSPRTRRWPAHRTCELVKEEAAHRVYNLRYGLVVGECPELAGHAAVGTKVLLAKVSVKSQMKLVCCTPRRCTPGAS